MPRVPGLVCLSARLPCRLRIPPFEKARTVLEALRQRRPVSGQRTSGSLWCHGLLQLCVHAGEGVRKAEGVC